MIRSSRADLVARNTYSPDLAYVHDQGFTTFAHRAAPELIRILRRHGIRSGLIVDVGCGSAPLARPLLDAGYRVLGIDRSPSMIRLARASVPDATFRVASLTTARLPRCAAVIALNEIVSYVADPAGRLTGLSRFFAHVYDALPPGGLLMFDFMASAEGRTYAGKSRAGADWAVVVRSTRGPQPRMLTRHITTFRKAGGEYRKTRETHRITIYDPEAVRAALRRRGFEVAIRRSYGRVRLLPGDVAIVARKCARS